MGLACVPGHVQRIQRSESPPMPSIMSNLRKRFGFHLLSVLAAPLDGLPPVRVEHPELAYIPLTEREALTWCEDPGMDLTPGPVAASYARGDLCVGVTEGGHPVGYVWFAFGAAPHADAWVQFDGATRYAYKAFIRAESRGRRISQELYTRAGEICPRRGRTQALVLVYTDNAVSLRASRRAGRRTIGWAGYWKCFGRILPFRTPGARRFGMRFSSPEVRGAGPFAARLKV